MELIFSMAIFLIFLMALVTLTAEMSQYEKRYPVNFMAHPQVITVLARLRRDVEDAAPPYYLESSGDFTMNPHTLILKVLKGSGYTVDVVWDFSHPGEVHRHEFNVGIDTEWQARGLPDFRITSFPIPSKPDSVRIEANDAKGILAIDQIIQPRPH